MARSSGFGHSNPVFDRNPAFTAGGGGGRFAAAPATMTAQQLQGMYDAPSATPVQTQRMTLDDVVVKGAIAFGTLITVAAASYFLLPAGLSALGMLAGLIVGLVLGLVIAFKQVTNPVVILSYAVAEGLLLGGISRIYGNAFGGDIVPQAILGTLAATVGMLVLFSTGRLRATPKFTKVLMTAAFAYLGVALLNLVLRLFGVVDGWGLYGGPLGLLLAAAGVAIASFFLILDFDFIQRGIDNGAPARYSWLAVAGLMMTVVWLYLEILRLLAILRGEE
jgi:uncharacterized YccA/Bax inhibitor family protein